LGMGQAHPVRSGTFLKGACAFDSRRYRQQFLERFGMGKPIRSEAGRT
jgi:hypothetical protein